ncbi:hypothetical protein KM043_000430 [Ampulex compressa]|nr:hypothetical protein KM043_000430 [Ampulex compressa]
MNSRSLDGGLDINGSRSVVASKENFAASCDFSLKMIYALLVLSVFEYACRGDASGSAMVTQPDLTGQLEQSQREIGKVRAEESRSVPVKKYEVRWKMLRAEPLEEERPFPMKICDRVYVLQGNRIVELSSAGSAIRETLSLRADRRVKFVRTITWKATLYLLLCYETDSCSLYTGSKDLEVKQRQTIGHRGSAMDADFFTRANQLYLVIADNVGSLAAPSAIYHWTGTYMDVVAEPTTTAAISVTTFQYRQSTILVFAQASEEKPGIGSVVYEFRASRIDRIQFLPSNGPLSVRHYSDGHSDFVLLDNRLEPSVLLWWNGHELLNWLKFADIPSPSFIRIVNVNEEAFFYAAYDNIIELYKIQSVFDYVRLSRVELEPEQSIIDVHVLSNAFGLNTILIITGHDRSYRATFWELNISQVLQENWPIETDRPRKCLSDLISLLVARMSEVEEAKASWPYLYPSREDTVVSQPFTLRNLILESGVIESIWLPAKYDIVAPRKIHRDIEDLAKEVERTSSILGNVIEERKKNTLMGDIFVRDKVFLDRLHVDSIRVDRLNDIDMLSEDVITSDEEQVFSEALLQKSISVEDVEVRSLCGIPTRFWALKDEASKVLLDVQTDKLEFSNDSAILRTDLSLPVMRTKTLNGMDVDTFYEETFIRNANQTIEGNLTYTDLVRIDDLEMEMLHDAPSDKLMTKATEQSLNDFFVKTVRIDRLYTDKINDVPVTEAARLSSENIVKGKVRISDLRIMEELALDENLNTSNIEHLQIYDNVTIQGDLVVKALDIGDKTNFFIDGDKISLDAIFNAFWTKSSDQVIAHNVSFDGGIVIDRLNVRYLNGRSPSDFLYTTSKDISENFQYLVFENVHMARSVIQEGEEATNVYSVGPKSFIIQAGLHIPRLQVGNLYTDAYDGIPVDQILDGKPLKFMGETNRPTINVNRAYVGKLHLRFLNNKTVSDLTDGTERIDNFHLLLLNVSDFRANSLTVRRINGLDLNQLTKFKNVTQFTLKRLIVDGNLTITNGFGIAQIEERSAETYLRNMVGNSTVIDSELVTLDLTVHNVTLYSLHGRSTDTLFFNTLSKSKNQTVPGGFSFYKITATNVTIDFVNERNASNLSWIDEPLFLTGSVNFTDLRVEGNIATRRLNDRIFHELYKSLMSISISKIHDLRVDGGISWENSVHLRTSISHLFENALTKVGNQSIYGNVTFENTVLVSTLSAEHREMENVRNIIYESVIDDGETITLNEKITFAENLTIGSLSVYGNINISMVNDTDILSFNHSVVKKYERQTVDYQLTFHEECAINHMYLNNDMHDTPLNALVLSSSVMPNNIHLKRLTVLKDVSLKNLDGVDFQTFVQDRVTLSGDRQIFTNMQFNGPLKVQGSATIAKINDIDTTDLVLNGLEGKQFITDGKKFVQNLEVTKNVYTPLLNNVNISAEYNRGIQNDENVEIYGNLIFEAPVKLSKGMTVAGLVNNRNIRMLSGYVRETSQQIIESLKENETRIEGQIIHALQMSRNLSNMFFHLETEDTLKIRVPNINKVEAIHLGTSVKLHMYGEQSGDLCGLPNACPCPTDYVAELDSNGCNLWKMPGRTVVRNFHEPNGIFGMNIVTNSTSSSVDCTSKAFDNEFTSISWVKPGVGPDGGILGLVDYASPKIKGFLRDAKVFLQNDAAYIVLAIYYDPVNATHLTDTLIYNLNIKNMALMLDQKISTDGAWALEIFKTNRYPCVYLLIGCFGPSLNSLLYRFNPSISKFELLRTFTSRSRYVKSLSQENDYFVLLDDFNTNAVNIYAYNSESDNFYKYQSLFHDSHVNGLECFYADDFGQNDAFVVITTEDGQLYIYEYMFVMKFQLKIQYWVDSAQTAVPFHYMDRRYMFVGTGENSTILRIVQQGPH